MFTWTNSGEGLPSTDLSITVLDGGSTFGGIDAMTSFFPTGADAGSVTWVFAATGFSAGAHTFNLTGFSSSGVGNGAVQATDGSLSLLVFG